MSGSRCLPPLKGSTSRSSGQPARRNGKQRKRKAESQRAPRGRLTTYARSMADERKQKTEKGLEISVPKRADFDALVKKVAGRPAGRKDPDGKDQPPKRSR